MKALLIEFDAFTGERAGGINPRDPALVCHGWQNFEREPAIEIRLITDSRDLSQYIGKAGVTVLEGKDAINRAISENMPVSYAIYDELLMIEHLKQKGISLDDFAGLEPGALAERLFAMKICGVRKIEPRLIG